MNDEIRIFEISEVRTSRIRDEPEHAVLSVKVGVDEFHFCLSLTGLLALGKQLQVDARLLSN